jgi:hypothetical protein
VTAVFVVMVIFMVVVLSPSCIDGEQCSPSDDVYQTIIGWMGLGTIIVSVITGWRGQLPGARGPASAPQPYKNRLRTLVLPLIAGVVFTGLFVLDLAVSNRKEYAFVDGDLAKHLGGRWDWENRKGWCGAGAHVIGFSPDRKVMTISLPPHGSDTGWVATYDVSNLTASRLRGAIRGETRLTPAGRPVVWELVMFGPNEYRWHRTDWRVADYTDAVVRCR